MLELLNRKFRSAGVETRTYESAERMLAEESLEGVSCLIVDIRLDGINGLELQYELNRKGVELPIVFISGDATVPDTIRAFKEGANAFFEKPFDSNELVATVLQLADAHVMKQRRIHELKSRLSPLTDREREVYQALVDGKKTTQIARELRISPSTVEKHRIHIFDKTGVSSVVDLVRLSLDQR
jgi:FixJ family two-component response regulator